jgi:hypothetical protein
MFIKRENLLNTLMRMSQSISGLMPLYIIMIIKHPVVSTYGKPQTTTTYGSLSCSKRGAAFGNWMNVCFLNNYCIHRYYRSKYNAFVEFKIREVCF